MNMSLSLSHGHNGPFMLEQALRLADQRADEY
jgi:hypothetical protein